MGFTHYYGFNVRKGNAEKNEKLYQQAIKDCHKVILAWQREHKGTECSLSGYSAHTKLGLYGGIRVNGKGKYSCEDFTLREHLKQNDSEFCKTARRPYDTVVVACLAIMKFHLKDMFDVGSDGDYHDFVAGVNYANKVLRRTKNKVNVPLPFDTKNDLKIVGE